MLETVFLIKRSLSFYISSSAATFIVVLILPLIENIQVTANTDVCHQLNTCACKMSNQSGVINLNHVAFFNGKPRFVISLDNSLSVAYNPCVGFTLAPTSSKPKEDDGSTLVGVVDECKDAAVCLFKASDPNSNYSNRGRPDSASFEFDKELNKLYISYTSPDLLFGTRVYLKCSSVDQLSVIRPKGNNTSLLLQLHSLCACPGGCPFVQDALSPGSYIVIVFVCILSIYLGFGMLYKKIVHSAEGGELVPNKESWTSFFTLVKDGYLFFISPCLGNTVEYRYYQKL